MTPYFDNGPVKLYQVDARYFSTLVAPGSVDLTVTSPPYNAGKTPGDDMPLDQYFFMLRQVFFQCFTCTKEGGWLAVNLPYWIGSRPKRFIPILVKTMIEEIGWTFQEWITWVKTSLEAPTATGTGWGNHPTYPRFRAASEPILLFRKPGPSIQGDHDISMKEWITYCNNVWVMKGAYDPEHPSVFPAELPRRLIKLLTVTDGLVLDPFCGTATTLAEAMRLGRRGIGFDTWTQALDRARVKIGNTPAHTIPMEIGDTYGETNTTDHEAENARKEGKLPLQLAGDSEGH